MKIGALVLCRYNSSRLPGKILKEINGKPILQYIIERLQVVKGLDEIIIATSKQESDNPIVDFCIENNIEYFRGDLENVASRFLACAQKYNLDYAIRINGDNLFIDTNILTEMVDLARKSNFDFVSNVKDRTFPKGMSIEIVKTDFYRNISEHFTTKYYQEHVTIYLYENENIGNFHFVKNKKVPEAAGLQFAIDTKEDFEQAQKILNLLPANHLKYNIQEIYKAFLQIQSNS